MNIISFLKHFYGFLIHIIILVVLLIISWINREYDDIYKDEKHAHTAIKEALTSYKKYEYLRVCGTSCTSIFTLFHEYSDAIANGKRICVFLLNPDDTRIIEHLNDCEHDKFYLIDTIRKNFSLLENQLSKQSAQKIKSLIRSDDCYGKKLMTASILLWKEAHKLAKKKNKGLTNGLEIYLYSHLPNLKAWIFGASFIFIGSYNPLPGGVGISNPIKKMKGNRKKTSQIIQDCRRVTNFLIDHPQTIRIKNQV